MKVSIMLLYILIMSLGVVLAAIFGLVAMLPVVLFLFIITAHLIVVRRKYINNNTHSTKSLSFAIKSLEQKKTEFKIINKLRFLSSGQKNVLKKLSVLVDNLFLKGDKSSRHNDYFGDPAYSLSVTNMFHDHKPQ